MKEIEISVEELIEKIKFLKKIKTDKDVASYLEITPNSLNNFKRRNSTGAFLEKVIYIALNRDNSLSFDFLLNPNPVNLSKLDEKYFEAKEISFSTKNEKKFESILDEFIRDQKPLSPVCNVLQTIKGQDLVHKFFEACSGKGERMLLVLYYFLKDLKKQNIDLKNVKKDFIKTLEIFEIPDEYRKKHLFVFGEKDKKNLIKWANENLDEVACFEIINSTDKLLELIQEQLNFLNKITVR